MRGHVRNKSSTVLGGGDSPKAEKRSKPSQKAMLSKALAKANTAVQLDNAQNFDGARKSYIEACELLHQVLARTTGDEDRKKLEAIVSPVARVMFVARLVAIINFGARIRPVLMLCLHLDCS